MRPEHSETKAKTATTGRVQDKDRDGDQKAVMRPRPKTTRPRPVWSIQLHVAQVGRPMLYYLISIT